MESVSIDGNASNATSSANNKSSAKALPNGNSLNYVNHSPRQPQTNIRRNEDNVIRLPRGPDGSSGFLLKR